MRSFLQTTEWLEFQKEAGHKVWRFDDGKIQANIIKYRLPFRKSYLYIPHGPEIFFEDIKGGIKNELSNFFKYLKDLARSEKAIFVKIEPLSDMVMELLYRRGIRRSSKQVQPYRTVVIDLDLPEEHLLGRMHQKTRYNINLSEKKDLRFYESSDVGTFWKLLKQTSEQDQFGTHPKEYYEKMLKFFVGGGGMKAKLFFVSYDKKPIAGEIAMLYGDTMYYLHGAMDRDHKNLMAPYFMHWEIMKWAKTQGLHNYDFWGIDANKWPGVTRFKLGWGGNTVEYPGSFDIPVSRIWYWAYSLARKVL